MNSALRIISLAMANGFANEIAKISFSLLKLLANGRSRQNSLMIADCECDGLVHSVLNLPTDFHAQYDWTTGVLDNGNEWRKFYLACTLCVPLFCALFNRGGNKRAFRLPVEGGDHFHCTVEPSPGHIWCRRFSTCWTLLHRPLSLLRKNVDVWLSLSGPLVPCLGSI